MKHNGKNKNNITILNISRFLTCFLLGNCKNKNLTEVSNLIKNKLMLEKQFCSSKIVCLAILYELILNCKVGLI